MRVIAMIIGDETAETGTPSTEADLAAMAQFNEDLVAAGVFVDGGGLQPTSRGYRVKFDFMKRTVLDGPFTESKELIAGFWLLEVETIAQALDWVARCPLKGGEIELRPLYEAADFADSDAIRRHAKVEQDIKKQRNNKSLEEF